VVVALLIGSSSAAALAKAKVKAAKKPKRAASSGGGFGAKTAAAAKSSKSAQESAVEKAIAAKAQALRVAPDLPGSWLELGALMAQTKEYAEAERIFRAGAARLPGHEMLSAAALSFGGDSGAYYHGDAAAPDGLPYTGPDFEAYTPPVEIMHAWDQADRSVDWTRAAVEERGAVFASNGPLLPPDECRSAIEATEAHAAANGVWTTDRHVQAPTTDVPVSRVPALRPWFDKKLEETLFPMLAARYPEVIPGPGSLRVMDAFVVRYDAGAQASLPVHQDENTFSFTIALNSKGEYEGGGTCFEQLAPVDGGSAGRMVLNADAGGVVTFPGKLLHGGNAVTEGRRYIIPLFIYLDANGSGKRPGYMLSSLGLEPPEGSDALSRYADAVGAARS
jgi:hypothetical protein